MLRLGIRQAGSSSSMLPAIAFAIVCFLGLAFKNLNKRFIRLILGKYALIDIPVLIGRTGIPAEQIMPI
jgi:hypothetical protein